MNADTLNSLRVIFKSYKRSASKLKDGAALLAKSGKLEFGMSWKEGDSVHASFDEGAALVRFAALLRPFMKQGSRVELTGLWSMLRENGLVDELACERVGQDFVEAENLGIGVVLNEKPLTARDLYHAYAEGRFFAQEPEAKQRLEQLAVGPMRQMVSYLFHSACLNYSRPPSHPSELKSAQRG
jgi:hypothetical protein